MKNTIQALKDQQAQIIYRNNNIQDINKFLDDLDVIGDITEIIIGLKRRK